MSLRIQPVRLYFDISHNWQRPAYTGSLFRGLFGHSLKALCCMIDNTECPRCPLRKHCVYAQTFEPRADLFNQHDQEIPRPFVINPPPASAPTRMKKGEQICLEMHLFGPAIQWLPILLQAWQGISQWPVDGNKNLFQLTQVELLDLNHQTIATGLPFVLNREFTGFIPETPAETPQHYHLDIITPLRLKQNKHNLNAHQLTGEIFIKNLYRRYSLLQHNYADMPEALSRLPADHYPALQQQLHWSDWQRWSNRQKRSIKLGGLIGQLQLIGELEPYRQAFSYLPWINLGKSCSLGLGQIQLANNP